MIFYGKYTFQSTNRSGPKKFLTMNHSDVYYPVVSADEATGIEHCILYQDVNSNLIIQMGDLHYLSAREELGWVVGDSSLDKAYPMKWIDQNNGEVALQIYLVDINQWCPIRYGFNGELPPYLVFSIPKGQLVDAEDTLYNFTKQTITPSLPDIQKSKNAQGLDFRNVDLSAADLSGVDCSGADFTNAKLDGVNFSSAKLCNATFVGASLDNTILSGATLDGAIFTKTDVSTVNWGEAILARKAQFDGCQGIGCKIGSNDMNKHADFSGANFEGADFSNSDFSYACLKEASLIRGVFVGGIFQRVDFTSAQLGGLDETAAANMAFAYMSNVNFSKANLFGVSFVSATVYGASTSMSNTATMEQVDFSNAYLEGIDLTGAILRGVKFNNACLVTVNFTQADLSPTQSGSITSSLVGACLQGAIFTQSKLAHADLTNATVDLSRGTIKVRYCNPILGGSFPPPPDFEPINYPATAGLDLITMTDETVCPNGLTVKANQRRNKTPEQMLTIADPATQWIPLQCSPDGALGSRKN